MPSGKRRIVIYSLWKKQPAVPFKFEDLKIIVADDNEFMRRLIRSTLQAIGFQRDNIKETDISLLDTIGRAGAYIWVEPNPEVECVCQYEERAEVAAAVRPAFRPQTPINLDQ